MVAGLVLLGCDDGSAYTLLSARGEHMRLHIATFDANEPDKYNDENCLIARELFTAHLAFGVRKVDLENKSDQFRSEARPKNERRYQRQRIRSASLQSTNLFSSASWRQVATNWRR
jgi:hypothetical protein